MKSHSINGLDNSIGEYFMKIISIAIIFTVWFVMIISAFMNELEKIDNKCVFWIAIFLSILLSMVI